MYSGANNQHQTPKPRLKGFSRRQKLVASMLFIAILIATLATVYFVKFRSPEPPIPPEAVSAAIFPLYYPAELPEGFLIDPTSFKSSQYVVLYQIKQENTGKIINVSLQPTLPDFDYDEFYKRDVVGRREVVTRSGPAILGTFSGAPISSMTTDTTWVILKADKGIKIEELETVTKSLIKYQEKT